MDASRGTMFGGVNDLVSQYGGASQAPAIAEQSAYRKGTLAKASEGRIAKNTLNAQSDSVQKKYAQVLRLALQSGQDMQTAVETARQSATDEAARTQAASISQKNRDNAFQKEDIAQGFTNQGLALEGQFAPTTDYKAAVTRALMGLGGSILTGYGLSKYYGGGSASPTSQPFDSSYGTSYLTGSTGMSTPLDLYGRRIFNG